MAGETQETTSSSPPQSELWEAAQYESALAHLERLQAQVDNLRSAIPSLVSPLVRPPAGSKAADMFAQMRTSALSTAKDLKTFRELWTSEQMSLLRDKAKQSLERDPDLSKASDVARWGWAEE